MLIYNNLMKDFFCKNKLISIIYILIIIILYPSQKVLLPSIMSKFIVNIKNGNLQYKKNINYLLITIVTLILLNCIFNQLKNYLEARNIPKYLSYLRKKLFKNLLFNSSNDFKEFSSSKVVSKIFDFTRNLKDFILIIVSEIIPVTITLIGIFIFFYKLNIPISILVVTSFLLIATILYRYIKLISTVSVEREIQYTNILQHLNEKISNLFNIYINNSINNEINQYYKKESLYTNIYTKQLTLTNQVSFTCRIVLAITYIIVILLGYNLILKNKLSTNQYLSIIFILNFFIADIDNIINYTPRIGTILGVFNFNSSMIKHIFNNINDKKYTPLKLYGKIIFKNVAFKYPNTKTYIYNNLNIKIKPNEFTAILGKSGTGKSSLAKMLLRINNLTKGKILLDNVNLYNYNIDYLRSNINYINQKTQLFNESIIYNLAYGNNKNLKEIIYLLKKYDLLSIYDRLEHKLHTNAGINGSNLSLGMQKITILIRGLLKKYPIIIIDEPLAGLDKNSRLKVCKLIKDKCKNSTTIIITHDMEILSICKNVINIDKISK